MTSFSRQVRRMGLAVAATAASVMSAAPAIAESSPASAFGEPESLGQPLQAVMVRSGAIGVWSDGRPVAYVVSTSKDQPINFCALDLRTGQRLAEHQITGFTGVGDTVAAADGKVYLPCSRSGRVVLVQYDPQRDAVTHLGEPVADEDVTTHAVSDENGVVYGGTYPGGHVYRYDPRKEGADAFTDYGPISEGEFYARSFAWGDGTLYVGTGTHARLFALDPASGDKREIEMPEEAKGQEFIYQMDYRDGLLFAYLSPSLDFHIYDLRAGKWIDRIERNGPAGVTPIDDRGNIYWVNLEKKSLLRYDLAKREASAVAFDSGRWAYHSSPAIGLARLDEPDYPGQSVVGVSQAGEIWHWNPQTGAGRRLDGDALPTAIGIRFLGLGPDGNIYVGGAFTPGMMGRYLTREEKLEQIGGPRGRVDSFEIHQGRFYFGTYTDAGVTAWDPAAGSWDFGRNPRRVLSLNDHKQERVYALASAGERLAIGGIGIKGNHNGVLAFYDPKSERLDVKGVILPGHGIASLAVHNNLLIGGTSNQQIGADPLVPEAKLFLWDLETDELVWQGVPVPGAPSINEVTVDDRGHVWGLTTLGVVFEFDPETREVLRTAQVGKEGGMWGMGTLFFGKDGMLYGSVAPDKGGVFSLDPRTLKATHLDDGEHAVTDEQGRIYYIRGAEVLRLTPRRPAAPAAARDSDEGHRPYALSDLNRTGIPPLLEGIESREQWDAKRKAIRRVWMEYVGGLPERVPVRYEVVSESQESDHIRQELIYDTVYGDRVTAYLLIPNEACEGGRRYPAVLALHPTNAQGKDSVATAEGRKNRTYGYELVSRGYIVLAPDAMTSGDRIFEGLEHFRSGPFYEKHPNWSTVGKNIVDHMQGVDLLAQHELVDAERIGAIGHSFGGYNAYFLAGADERVKAAVSSCGFSPFTRSEDPGHWGVRDWYTHLPRISDDMAEGRVPFEFHEIIALSTPRPLFFYSAQSDHIFPHWEPIAASMLDLHQLYVWLGVEERFVSVIGPGDHDFPEPIREMAYGFLDRWLKPSPASQ